MKIPARNRWPARHRGSAGQDRAGASASSAPDGPNSGGSKRLHSPQSAEEIASRLRCELGVLRADRRGQIHIDGQGFAAVAGPSFHQEAIRRAGRGNLPHIYDLERAATFDAELVPEPLNAHDPNAVAVHMRSHHVGYLDSSTAAGCQGALLAITRRGYRVWCQGLVARGDQVAYKAYLRVFRPDESKLRRQFAASLTGAQEGLWGKHYVEAARRYPDPEALEVLLETVGEHVLVNFVLRPAPVSQVAPRSGPVIELIVEGQTLGELTSVMAQRHRAQIERCIGREKAPVVEGYLYRHRDGNIRIQVFPPYHPDGNYG